MKGVYTMYVHSWHRYVYVVYMYTLSAPVHTYMLHVQVILHLYGVCTFAPLCARVYIVCVKTHVLGSHLVTPELLHAWTWANPGAPQWRLPWGTRSCPPVLGFVSRGRFIPGSVQRRVRVTRGQTQPGYFLQGQVQWHCLHSSEHGSCSTCHCPLLPHSEDACFLSVCCMR